MLKAATGTRCEDEPECLQAEQEWSYFDSPVPQASELMGRSLELHYEVEIGRREDHNLITKDRKNVKRLIFN